VRAARLHSNVTSLSPLYPAPGEARAKRRGGRGFYKDRGLPYKRKFEERDQCRSLEEREAAALGRALAELARKHPRFKKSLNRVRHHVLVQVRSPKWKRHEISKRLSAEPITVEEIMEETCLDQASILETLTLMMKDQQAEQCTRGGGKVKVRSDGKPAEKVYWRGSHQSDRAFVR